jgi:RNA polymerase sigma factor (sigma-70 family)
VSEPSATDVDLVGRAQAGDIDAYAALVQRYQAMAIGLAAVVTRDPANAEDVAQEAFIKAYSALGRFRPGASFRAWLVRIVVNEARDARATARRRAVLDARVQGDSSRVTAAASAEDMAIANEQHGALLKILDRQREDDRAVLMYRYFLDLSEAEMAEALACSPGTVKSRLSRALARLRQDLGKAAPLLALTPNLGTLLGESMSHAVGPVATAPSHDLAALVLHGVAAGGLPSAGPSGPGRLTPQHVVAAVSGGLVVVALAAIGLLLSTSNKRGPVDVPIAAPLAVSSPAAAAPTVGSVSAPPRLVVVYRGDLTDAQRQELSLTFGTGRTVITDSVSRDELDSTLHAAGLPVDGSEQAISSAIVNCLNPGDGLSVRHPERHSNARGCVRECTRHRWCRRRLGDRRCATEYTDDGRNGPRWRAQGLPTLPPWPASSGLALASGVRPAACYGRYGSAERGLGQSRRHHASRRSGCDHNARIR